MAGRRIDEGKKKSETESPRQKRAQAVKDLVSAVEKKLTEEVGKVTLADYIKLVQLQKELEEEEPREIRVTWVDPEEKKPESES